jgi:hypothetical protein
MVIRVDRRTGGASGRPSRLELKLQYALKELNFIFDVSCIITRIISVVDIKRCFINF